MHPGLVATSFSDWRNAGVLLKGGGIGEALTALTEGHEEPWRERRASARQRTEEVVVGQRGAEPSDLVVKALYGGASSPELGNERFNQQTHRQDHRGVGGQRLLRANGFDASCDRGRVAH